MRCMKLTIAKSMPLLEALSILCPDSSKTKLREFVRQGRIMVDNKPITRTDIELIEGQQVWFEEHKVKWEDGLKIVFEDSSLVVIDKPNGLLSVSTNFEKKKTAHALLKKRYYPKKVFVIHRLDQDTSGLLIFTADHKAYVSLKDSLKKRHIRRTYHAIVEGTLEGSGTWSSYLKEDASYMVHASDNPADGELAVTHYEALEHKNGCTLVRFTLDTGKKNQIRVQSSRAGFPVCGDVKYGARTNRYGRLALHATNLEFCHPETEKTLKLCSNFPISL